MPMTSDEFSSFNSEIVPLYIPISVSCKSSSTVGALSARAQPLWGSNLSPMALSELEAVQRLKSLKLEF